MTADTNIKTITQVYEAFEEFTPVSVAASDADVLTVVRFRARSRRTGKSAAMDLHHFFRFRDGKIAYYRGTEDTALTEATLRD